MLPTYLLRLVASWVNRGWSDAEILLYAPALTMPTYKVSQTREELLAMRISDLDDEENAGAVDARIQTVMVLGGEPVGERFIYWNFVSSSKDRLAQAASDWRDGRMKLPDADDVEFIPLPEELATVP